LETPSSPLWADSSPSEDSGRDHHPGGPHADLRASSSSFTLGSAPSGDGPGRNRVYEAAGGDRHRAGISNITAPESAAKRRTLEPAAPEAQPGRLWWGQWWPVSSSCCRRALRTAAFVSFEASNRGMRKATASKLSFPAAACSCRLLKSNPRSPPHMPAKGVCSLHNSDPCKSGPSWHEWGRTCSILRVPGSLSFRPSCVMTR
jgi:hypothetical protein